MPKIEPYVQQTRASSAGLGPGPVNEASTTPRAIAAFGQAMQGIEDDRLHLKAFDKQKLEERGAVQSQERLMTVRGQWVEELQKRQSAATESADGFAQSTLDDFDKGIPQHLEGLPTERSRQWLKSQLGETRLSLQRTALAFEAERAAQYKLTGLERAADQARISAEFQPDAFATLAAEQFAAIEASGLHADTRAQLRVQSVEKIAGASVQGMIRRNPYGALRELNDEGSKSQAVRALSFDQRQALRRQAETEIHEREADMRQRQAEARQVLGERVRDATAAYRAGLEFESPPSRAEFIATLGGEDGNQAFEAFTKEQELGVDIRALARLPTREQAELLAQRAPVGEEGVADAIERHRVLQQRAAQLHSDREADPAAYAFTYAPRVREAYRAMNEAGGDPAAAQEYARATLAEQQRLGVSAPTVLPKAQVSAIADVFHRQPKGGESFATLIAQEQQRWGRYWPQVFGQLSAEKIPGSVLAIGRGMAPGPASRLANVATIPMGELKKGVRLTMSSGDMLDEVDRQMDDFTKSLGGVVGAEYTRSGMRDSIERLTYLYAAQGQGTTAAAKQAYQEVLGDHYDFHEFNGRTFRIPVEVTARFHRAPTPTPFHAPLDAEDMAELVLEGIDLSDAKPPVPTAFSAEEIAQEDLVRAVRDRGYWVTSADNEKGLALFLDEAPVQRRDGSVYELSWDQLSDAALAQRRRLNEAAIRQKSGDANISDVQYAREAVRHAHSDAAKLQKSGTSQWD